MIAPITSQAQQVEVSLSESLPAFLEQRRALADKLAANPGAHLVEELTLLVQRSTEIERLVRLFVVHSLYEGTIQHPLITDDRNKPLRDPEAIRSFLTNNRGGRELLAGLIQDENKKRTGYINLLAFPEPIDKGRAEIQRDLMAQAILKAQGKL